MDRASDYGSEGCKFESCRVRHLETAERQFFFISVGLAIPPSFQLRFSTLFQSGSLLYAEKQFPKLFFLAQSAGCAILKLSRGSFFYTRWIGNSTIFSTTVNHLVSKWFIALRRKTVPQTVFLCAVCRVRHLKTVERQFFLYPLDLQFHHLFNYGSTPCFKVVHCFTQKNSSPLKAYFVYFSGFKAFNRKLECSFS